MTDHVSLDGEFDVVTVLMYVCDSSMYMYVTAPYVCI